VFNAETVEISHATEKKPKPVAPQPTGQATPEDAESFAQTLIDAVE